MQCGTPFSDGPAFHLEVTMGHRLRKSFVRNAFIPDLEVNNKSKGYGVSQRLNDPKAGIEIIERYLITINFLILEPT